MKMISPMVSAAVNFPRLEGTASPLSLTDTAHTRTASVLLLYLSLQPRAEKTHASSAGLTLQYSSNPELPWDTWSRQASFWLYSPSRSRLLGFLGVPTPFGLIQLSHLAMIAGNPGISVSQSRWLSEEETLGSSRKERMGSSCTGRVLKGLASLLSVWATLLWDHPSPHSSSQPREMLQQACSIRKAISAFIFQKGREQSQTQGSPLPLPAASFHVQGGKPVSWLRMHIGIHHHWQDS